MISVGRIFKALTGSSGVPSENPPALRLALGLRTVAIRSARKKELTGFILTSNGNDGRTWIGWSPRPGADGVTIIKLTEAQACARVAALVPAGANGARRARNGRQVGAGLHAISRAPTDREVEP